MTEIAAERMFVYELPKTVFCLTTALVLGFCRDYGPASVPLITGRIRWLSSLREIPVWLVLIFILVVPCLVGSLGSVVAVGGALLYAIPALRRPGAWDDLRWQPGMVLFVAVFVALTAIFAITARQPTDVSYSLNFLAFLLAPVVFLMAREKPADDTRLIMILCLTGAAAAAAMSLGELAITSARATGLFGGPNLFPRIALPLGFIAIGGALMVPGRWRLVFYLGPVLAVVAVLLSGSRGAMLALAPVTIIAVSALAIRRTTRRDLFVLAGLAVVAIVAVVFLAPGVPDPILSAITSTGEVLAGAASTDAATHERQVLFAAGWSGFLSSPWIGHGWANLGHAAAAANPATFASIAGVVFMFHNDALDFAVAGGVLGLLVYLVILVAPIVGALAAPRDVLRVVRIYGTLILSVSFAVFGLSDMTLGYDVTTTLYAFLTALLLGVRVPFRR